tara:strand:+ start:367 stop:1212 length:846 start_codon:yes stop_codon:yes gene_type:complete
MTRKPTKYAIDDIKSRFQTVAIDNRYQVFLRPNATIYTAARRVGVNRRFIDEDLGLYCSDAILPGSNLVPIEVVGDRQGITEKLPFSRIYDDVTFTFMVDRDYKTLKFFESWLQTVNPLHGSSSNTASSNAVTTFNYPKDYKIDLGIIKFNKDFFETKRGSVSRYTFFEAFPLSIAGSPVNYESGSVLKLNVTIAYTRFIMDDVTRTMKRFGRSGLSDSGDVGNLDDDTTVVNVDLQKKVQKNPSGSTISAPSSNFGKNLLNAGPSNNDIKFPSHGTFRAF